MLAHAAQHCAGDTPSSQENCRAPAKYTSRVPTQATRQRSWHQKTDNPLTDCNNSKTPPDVPDSTTTSQRTTRPAAAGHGIQHTIQSADRRVDLATPAPTHRHTVARGTALTLMSPQARRAPAHAVLLLFFIVCWAAGCPHACATVAPAVKTELLWLNTWMSPLYWVNRAGWTNTSSDPCDAHWYGVVCNGSAV